MTKPKVCSSLQYLRRERDYQTERDGRLHSGSISELEKEILQVRNES